MFDDIFVFLYVDWGHEKCVMIWYDLALLRTLWTDVHCFDWLRVLRTFQFRQIHSENRCSQAELANANKDSIIWWGLLVCNEWASLSFSEIHWLTSELFWKCFIFFLLCLFSDLLEQLTTSVPACSACIPVACPVFSYDTFFIKSCCGCICILWHSCPDITWLELIRRSLDVDW